MLRTHDDDEAIGRRCSFLSVLLGVARASPAAAQTRRRLLKRAATATTCVARSQTKNNIKSARARLHSQKILKWQLAARKRERNSFWPPCDLTRARADQNRSKISKKQCDERKPF